MGFYDAVNLSGKITYRVDFGMAGEGESGGFNSTSEIEAKSTQKLLHGESSIDIMLCIRRMNFF